MEVTPRLLCPSAAWIDAIALAARRILEGSDADEFVVGHTDWRVGNMRFSEGKASAVYDWDSLRIIREPEVVGSVAHLFTADHAVPSQRRFPTLAEALSFVSDYEAAYGKAFTSDEQRVVRAALAYSMAYTARCAHSDRSTEFGRRAARANQAPSLGEDTPGAFLVAHASELLGTEIALPAVEQTRPALITPKATAASSCPPTGHTRSYRGARNSTSGAAPRSAAAGAFRRSVVDETIHDASEIEGAPGPSADGPAPRAILCS